MARLTLTLSILSSVLINEKTDERILFETGNSVFNRHLFFLGLSFSSMYSPM